MTATAQAPDLKLVVTKVGSDVVLRLLGPNGLEIGGPFRGTAADLAAANLGVRDDLAKFKMDCQRESLRQNGRTLAKRVTVLDYLIQVGRTYKSNIP